MWIQVTSLRGRAVQLLSIGAMLLVAATMLWRCSPGEGENDAGTKCLTGRDCTDLDVKCKDGKCFCKAGTCERRQNNPPTADAGPDQQVKVGEKVFLSGDGSFDQDGDPPSFQWSFVSKPDDSQVTLSDADKSRASFAPDKAGVYLLKLEVSDGQATSSDEVEVKVTRGENNAPKADAGSDRSVEVGKEVALDGSRSSDPDGDKLTFKWTLTPPTGSAATLSDETAEKPTFTADVAGEYEVQLEVSDGDKSDTATIKVTASKDANIIPEVTSVTPNRLPAGAIASVKVVGKQFSAGAVVLFRSREVAPKTSRDTELEVDLDLLTVPAGKYPLQVKNTNGQTSQAVEVEVFVVPAPTITTLSPEKAGAGASFTLTVNGTNFVNGSEVYFTGTTLKTTYKSDTVLEATLDLTGVSTGFYPVRVRSPGGKDSNIVNFEVTVPPPPPEITIINPEEAKAGAPVDLQVFGKRFNQGSVLLFDGKEIKTQYVGVGELKADPKLDLTNVVGGVYKVRVRDVQGYLSNEVNFTVLDQYPPPQLSSVSPATGVTQSLSRVTISGKRIDPKAIVYLDGTKAKTSTFMSSTQIQAEIDLQSKAPGTYKLWVENPAPQGQTKTRKSNELDFKVNPLPPPSISSISYGYVYSQKKGTIEVIGQGFTPSTVIQVSSRGTRSTSTSYCRSNYLPASIFQDKPTTFISSTRLQATFVMPQTTSYTNRSIGVRVKRGTDFSGYKCFYVQYSGSPPTPILRTLSPVAVNQGTTSPVSVKLSGSSFDRFSIVYFNKKQIANVTYNSASQLTAAFDIAGLSTGSYDVQVESPSGLKSAVLKFTLLKQGQPLLQSISPTEVYAGNSYTLTLSGTGFDPKAKVEAGGKPITGTVKYNSASSITVSSAKILAQAQGAVPIVVVNPNNLKSNPVSLTVRTYPAPRVTSASPTSYEEGSVVSRITVYGSNFRSGAAIEFTGGKKTVCSYSSSSRLYCNNADVSGVPQGKATFVIVNPDGVKSNAYNVTITAPSPPTLSSISPTTAYNNEIITLTVNGSRFGTGTQIVFGSKVMKATYVSSSKLTAKIDLNGTPQGILQVKVRNTLGGKNYDSNGTNFVVLEPPTPVLSYFSPMRGTKGTKTTVNIYGSDFNPGSKVLLNNVAQKITSHTSTKLTVELDLSSLSKGSATLQVDNGANKKSALVGFAVVDPPGPSIREVRPAGVTQSLTNSTITIYGSNFDKNASVTVKGSPVALKSATSTTLQFQVPFPKQLYPANSKIEIRVTNPDSQSAADFIYVMDPSAPLINYVSPASSMINKSVTLNIYGVSSLSGVNLFLDGVKRSYTYRGSYIQVPGFATGNQVRNVEIKVQKGTAFSNPYFFKVLPENAPSISYLQPPFAKAGSTVNLTIRGSYFNTSPLSTVRFNGKVYTPSTSGSSTSALSVSIPLTSVSAGPKTLQVRNPDLQLSQTVYFYVNP